MNQLVQPHGQIGAAQVLQVTPQTLQFVMGVIMAVWAGTWVLSQVIKVVKGEEVEKPPLIPK